MRSRSGCLTCRLRKIKCDETQPVCGQCQKSERECRFGEKRIFRHQQNASMIDQIDVAHVQSRRRERSAVPPRAYYRGKKTYSADDVWVEVPREPAVSFTEPETLGNNVTAEHGRSSDGVEDQMWLSDGTLQEDYHESIPSNFYSDSPASENELLRHSHHSDLEEHQPISEARTAFLLRHFSQATGQWMDLFDLGCYFALYVPVLALSNPLVQYAACAYAAKQLGRVKVSNNTGVSTFLYSPQSQVDWSYHAAKYYDKAISLLAKELAHTGMHERPSDRPVLLPDRGVQSDPVVSQSRFDETITATAILCVTEFLENASHAWSLHLSGTKSLFDLTDKYNMLTSANERHKLSKARRATFWNFARQDFLAAFINEHTTRMNTEDFMIWKAAGLELRDLHYSTNNGSSCLDAEARREDMVSNALIWHLSKLVNFLDALRSFNQASRTPFQNNYEQQKELLERWQQLNKDFGDWHANVPPTFKPCARLPLNLSGNRADNPGSVFPQIWFSIPMCASTMQSYHMARILLLTHQPPAMAGSPAPSSEERRVVDEELRWRSYEIAGITLSRSDNAVRIHSVQPLFVAGLCLEDEAERRHILHFLREIEDELGWATRYRVRRLLSEWKWDGVQRGFDWSN